MTRFILGKIGNALTVIISWAGVLLILLMLALSLVLHRKQKRQTPNF